jgi:hypothetical protein
MGSLNRYYLYWTEKYVLIQTFSAFVETMSRFTGAHSSLIVF